MFGRSLLAFAAILCLGLSLSACHGQRAACPAGKQCLEYGNANDPVSINPQLVSAVNEATIMREMFQGLYADGPEGQPVPGAATSHETSADGLTWTFHLRPNAAWSDGVPLTAHDFVFAYQHMLDPKTGSSYAYLLYVLKNAEAVNEGKAQPDALGARAVDDHTLVLTLEHPASFLPELLKHQAFFPIPEHAVKRWGDDWAQPGRIVGNGAYVLTTWRLGDYIRLEKNPHYQGDGDRCFDIVNFYPLNDLVSSERRALAGEIDVNAGIQSNRVPRLRNDPKSAQFVRAHPALSTSYILFNNRDVAPLKALQVRTAMSMSIDRAFITDKLLRAGQVPTASFVPPGIAGYLPANVPHPGPIWAAWSLERRQAAARVLMARAGYTSDHPLKLELKTFNSGGSLTTAQSIQADLRAIGIDATFRQEDGAVIFQSFEQRDFQIGIAGWVADYDDPMTFLALMRSDTGLQNYGDYRNPRYDALIDRADNEPDGAKRAQYLAQAEQLMLNDANIAPLLVSVNLNLVNPTINGWVDNSSDIHPIRYLCRNAAAAKGAQTAP
jgi:oligopeptide transport system substrate-binding protein